MTMIRSIAAALVLGASVLATTAAQAYTLSVGPSPLNVGGVGTLNIGGTLSGVNQLDVHVSITTFNGAAISLNLPADPLDLLSAAVSNKADGIGFDNGSTTTELDFSFLAGDSTKLFSVNNSDFFGFTFTGDKAGSVTFVATICAIGSDEVCDPTGGSTLPGAVRPETVEGSLRIIGGTRIPEPGSLALLAVTVLAGAGAVSRRNRH